MALAIVASLLGLVTVLVAYYRDAPLEQRTLVAPSWDVLPDPAEVARVVFPMAVPGYDPATVEFHFDLLTRAYADLLAVAPPEVLTRARHRAAVRRGIDPDTLPPRELNQPPAASSTALGALTPEGPDAAALRAEAALADLETAPPPEADRP